MSIYTTYPFGDYHWKSPVSTSSALPSSGNNIADARITLDTSTIYVWDGSAWNAIGGGGGSGTVTSVSVATAHGLSGTVANPTTTPAITLSTTITGILQGNGTSISAATVGNLTDVGTDGIAITGGTGAVLGSGTSIAQQVANTTQNGYLTSTDWNTFNNKQASGNYITALTGDVTAIGPGSASSVLSSFVNRVYVDFVTGSNSGTGTPLSPWKTLQHAYNSISPSINEPYAIFISGGNNDSDSTTITGKPNVALIADYPIQILQPLTISGGITNDDVWFFNLIFLGALTWIRNDATEISMYLINSETSGLLDFEQNGSGLSGSFFYANSGGGITNGLTLQVGEAILSGLGDISGTINYKDSGAAVLIVLGLDLYNASFEFNGGITAEFSGCIADVGYTISGTTTGSGTPALVSDSGSLPPSISGAYSLTLTSQSQYVSYTVADSSKWASPAPTNVKNALDRIAAVVGNGTPIP